MKHKRSKKKFKKNPKKSDKENNMQFSISRSYKSRDSKPGYMELQKIFMDQMGSDLAIQLAYGLGRLSTKSKKRGSLRDDDLSPQQVHEPTIEELEAFIEKQSIYDDLWKVPPHIIEDDVYINGTTGAVDPAFRKIKKKHSEFLIWRIENLQLVAIQKENYGNFFDGDSYIIFASSQYGHPCGPSTITRELKGGAEYHIHFWLGQTTTSDKAGAAAYKAMELDGYLGGTSTQHREVQGNESPRFRSYFHQIGMKILSGDTESYAGHHVGNFKATLYKVKGKRAPVMTEMPSISWTHFNSGEVFILQTSKTVYIWIGRVAPHKEKLHAAQAASMFKTENNISNIIFVDDGYERTIHEDDLKDFETYLPMMKRNVKPMIEGVQEERDDQYFRGNIKLYRCSECNDKYRVTEVKSGPLKQNDLQSEDVFILDHNIYGVWVWVGIRANDKERTEAMRNARGFVKKKKYPSYTPVTRVIDKAEPFEFKALFAIWKEKEESLPLVKGLAKPVTKVKVTRYDAVTMHDRPQVAARSQLVDDGSGTIRKWIINDKEIINIPKERHSVFFSGNCYVLEYTYTTPLCGRVMIYYWLGIDSEPDDQGAALLKTLEMDLEAGGTTHLGRVIQGCEPPHFLQIFKGKMRTFRGISTDYDPSFKNLKTPGHYLLQIQGSATFNTKATQVPLKPGSLNSNYCFVLRKGSHYYVWCGNFSNGDNREMAKAFAGTDFVLILEGNETSDFWHIIGGKGPYTTEKIIEEKRDIMPARLFQLSNVHGIFKIEEILNFTQEDLGPEDVMILDAFNVIYLWNGELAPKEERHMTLSQALDYLEADPAGRNQFTHMEHIKQGNEPPTFTGFFESWDPAHWKGHKTYNDLREEIELNTLHLHGRSLHKLTKIPDEFDEYNKYPISVLTGPTENLPSTVNHLKKELHLTYDDFITLIGMKYNDFKVLPYWKQQEIKKKVGLF